MSSENIVDAVDEEDAIYFVFYSGKRPPLPPAERINIPELIPPNIIPDYFEQEVYVTKRDGRLVVFFRNIYDTGEKGVTAVRGRPLQTADNLDKYADGLGGFLTLALLYRSRQIRAAAKAKIKKSILVHRASRAAKRAKGRKRLVGAGYLRPVGKQKKAARLAKRLARRKPRYIRAERRALRRVVVMQSGLIVTSPILGPLLIAATVIDLILIGERGIIGYEKAGKSGFVGGIAAGILDAASLSLVPESGLQKTESFVQRLVAQGQGAPTPIGNVSLHPKDSAYYGLLQSLGSGLVNIGEAVGLG